MKHFWIDKKPYHFEKHGISIIVPDQDLGIKIQPKSPPDEIPDEIPEPVTFTLIRKISTIELFRKEDIERSNYQDPVEQFEPPIELRVGYGQSELDEVEDDIHRLVLAYWNMQEWIIISNKFHEYQILPPSIGQIAEAKIYSWIGDPTIAWGK